MKKQEAILDFYSKCFKENGPNDVHSLGWGSRLSQERRFKVITEIGIADFDTVLDVGCGFGDYKTYLNRIEKKAWYHGLDINDTFLRVAEDNHKGVKFTLGNMSVVFEDFDWCVASGIFALEYEAWEEETIRTISAMMNRARKGIAVNFLSSLHRRKGIEINRFVDPQWAITEIVLKLTRKFTLRHDYFDNDFTVYLYKE